MLLMLYFYLGIQKSRRKLPKNLKRSELPSGFPTDCSHGRAKSPLKTEKLLPWLDRYPDRVAAEFLKNGLINGFSLNSNLNIAHVHFDNLNSAKNNPSIVWPLLAKEIKAGRLSGPHTTIPFPMRISPIGVIPKSQDDSISLMLMQAGAGDDNINAEVALMHEITNDLNDAKEYRLIFDLSAEDEWGQSVNSVTDEAFRSVTYTAFDAVVEKLSKLPIGGHCSKSDLKSAFRVIALSESEFPLTGIQYQGWIFYDRCMPFGSSTAPFSYEIFATFLNWLVIQFSNDPGLSHFLDDFFAYGCSDTVVNKQMDTFHSVVQDVGVPVNFDKYVPATTRICFLGLIIDMVLRMIIAPQIKVLRAWEGVQKLLSKRKHKVSFIQSVQGRLSFICRAVAPGRAHLSRGYRLIAGKKGSDQVTLSRGYVNDLRSWKKFLQSYNGQTFFRDFTPTPHMGWYTDASSTWGAGSWIRQFNQYFVLPWPRKVLLRPESTALLEICPIVVSLFQPEWETHFRNKSLQVFCDNFSTCQIIRRQSSGVPKIAQWLRCMVLRCMQLNCTVQAVWVSTSEMPSDPLSRNNIPLFLSQVGGEQNQIRPLLSGLPSLLTLARSHNQKGH